MSADLPEGNLLALGHVRRAAYDGHLLAADIDGGKLKPIGVRMLLNLRHKRDVDALPVATQTLDAVDFLACHRKPVSKLLWRQVNIDIFRKPA